ncbi:hypothetical protein HYH03_005163 [Edaphochlamys debaryana]|uniref:Uncharacterized protein n=1 Tax=Edaphochlamys debaryana TaxID=47281 RepID=A0A835Y7X3_9CHLO|nr:hypothetical protein HYH03_005163 [Edaphochlamys debaryana]|eukprot:KAG2496754.1 hypothetical protein HYH03_005163 [Edaphochlamys debaryana]
MQAAARLRRVRLLLNAIDSLLQDGASFTTCPGGSLHHPSAPAAEQWASQLRGLHNSLSRPLAHSLVPAPPAGAASFPAPHKPGVAAAALNDSGGGPTRCLSSSAGPKAPVANDAAGPGSAAPAGEGPGPASGPATAAQPTAHEPQGRAAQPLQGSTSAPAGAPPGGAAHGGGASTASREPGTRGGRAGGRSDAGPQPPAAKPIGAVQSARPEPAGGGTRQGRLPEAARAQGRPQQAARVTEAGGRSSPSRGKQSPREPTVEEIRKRLSKELGVASTLDELETCLRSIPRAPGPSEPAPAAGAERGSVREAGGHPARAHIWNPALAKMFIHAVDKSHIPPAARLELLREAQACWLAQAEAELAEAALAEAKAAAPAEAAGALAASKAPPDVAAGTAARLAAARASALAPADGGVALQEAGPGVAVAEGGPGPGAGAQMPPPLELWRPPLPTIAPRGQDATTLLTLFRSVAGGTAEAAAKQQPAPEPFPEGAGALAWGEGARGEEERGSAPGEAGVVGPGWGQHGQGDAPAAEAAPSLPSRELVLALAVPHLLRFTRVMDSAPPPQQVMPYAVAALAAELARVDAAPLPAGAAQLLAGSGAATSGTGAGVSADSGAGSLQSRLGDPGVLGAAWAGVLSAVRAARLSADRGWAPDAGSFMAMVGLRTELQVALARAQLRYPGRKPGPRGPASAGGQGPAPRAAVAPAGAEQPRPSRDMDASGAAGPDAGAGGAGVEGQLAAGEGGSQFQPAAWDPELSLGSELENGLKHLGAVTAVRPDGRDQDLSYLATALAEAARSVEAAEEQALAQARGWVQVQGQGQQRGRELQGGGGGGGAGVQEDAGLWGRRELLAANIRGIARSWLSALVASEAKQLRRQDEAVLACAKGLEAERNRVNELAAGLKRGMQEGAASAAALKKAAVGQGSERLEEEVARRRAANQAAAERAAAEEAATNAQLADLALAALRLQKPAHRTVEDAMVMERTAHALQDALGRRLARLWLLATPSSAPTGGSRGGQCAMPSDFQEGAVEDIASPEEASTPGRPVSTRQVLDILLHPRNPRPPAALRAVALRCLGSNDYELASTAWSHVQPSQYDLLLRRLLAMPASDGWWAPPPPLNPDKPHHQPTDPASGPAAAMAIVEAQAERERALASAFRRHDYQSDAAAAPRDLPPLDVPNRSELGKVMASLARATRDCEEGMRLGASGGPPPIGLDTAWGLFHATAHLLRNAPSPALPGPTPANAAMKRRASGEIQWSPEAAQKLLNASAMLLVRYGAVQTLPYAHAVATQYASLGGVAADPLVLEAMATAARDAAAAALAALPAPGPCPPPPPPPPPLPSAIEPHLKQDVPIAFRAVDRVARKIQRQLDLARDAVEPARTAVTSMLQRLAEAEASRADAEPGIRRLLAAPPSDVLRAAPPLHQHYVMVNGVMPPPALLRLLPGSAPTSEAAFVAATEKLDVLLRGAQGVSDLADARRKAQGVELAAAVAAAEAERREAHLDHLAWLRERLRLAAVAAEAPPAAVAAEAPPAAAAVGPGTRMARRDALDALVRQAGPLHAALLPPLPGAPPLPPPPPPPPPADTAAAKAAAARAQSRAAFAPPPPLPSIPAEEVEALLTPEVSAPTPSARLVALYRALKEEHNRIAHARGSALERNKQLQDDARFAQHEYDTVMTHLQNARQITSQARERARRLASQASAYEAGLGPPVGSQGDARPDGVVGEKKKKNRSARDTPEVVAAAVAVVQVRLQSLARVEAELAVTQQQVEAAEAALAASNLEVEWRRDEGFAVTAARSAVLATLAALDPPAATTLKVELTSENAPELAPGRPAEAQVEAKAEAEGDVGSRGKGSMGGQDKRRRKAEAAAAAAAEAAADVEAGAEGGAWAQARLALRGAGAGGAGAPSAAVATSATEAGMTTASGVGFVAYPAALLRHLTPHDWRRPGPGPGPRVALEAQPGPASHSSMQSAAPPVPAERVAAHVATRLAGVAEVLAEQWYVGEGSDPSALLGRLVMRIDQIQPRTEAHAQPGPGDLAPSTPAGGGAGGRVDDTAAAAAVDGGSGGGGGLEAANLRLMCATAWLSSVPGAASRLRARAEAAEAAAEASAGWGGAAGAAVEVAAAVGAMEAEATARARQLVTLAAQRLEAAAAVEQPSQPSYQPSPQPPPQLPQPSTGWAAPVAARAYDAEALADEQPRAGGPAAGPTQAPGASTAALKPNLPSEAAGDAVPVPGLKSDGGNCGGAGGGLLSLRSAYALTEACWNVGMLPPVVGQALAADVRAAITAAASPLDGGGGGGGGAEGVGAASAGPRQTEQGRSLLYRRMVRSLLASRVRGDSYSSHDLAVQMGAAGGTAHAGHKGLDVVPFEGRMLMALQMLDLGVIGSRDAVDLLQDHMALILSRIQDPDTMSRIVRLLSTPPSTSSTSMSTSAKLTGAIPTCAVGALPPGSGPAGAASWGELSSATPPEGALPAAPKAPAVPLPLPLPRAGAGLAAARGTGGSQPAAAAAAARVAVLCEALPKLAENPATPLEVLRTACAVVHTAGVSLPPRALLALTARLRDELTHPPGAAASGGPARPHASSPAPGAAASATASASAGAARAAASGAAAAPLLAMSAASAAAEREPLLDQMAVMWLHQMHGTYGTRVAARRLQGRGRWGAEAGQLHGMKPAEVGAVLCRLAEWAEHRALGPASASARAAVAELVPLLVELAHHTDLYQSSHAGIAGSLAKLLKPTDPQPPAQPPPQPSPALPPLLQRGECAHLLALCLESPPALRTSQLAWAHPKGPLSLLVERLAAAGGAGGGEAAEAAAALAAEHLAEAEAGATVVRSSTGAPRGEPESATSHGFDQPPPLLALLRALRSPAPWRPLADDVAPALDGSDAVQHPINAVPPYGDLLVRHSVKALPAVFGAVLRQTLRGAEARGRPGAAGASHATADQPAAASAGAAGVAARSLPADVNPTWAEVDVIFETLSAAAAVQRSADAVTIRIQPPTDSTGAIQDSNGQAAPPPPPQRSHAQADLAEVATAALALAARRWHEVPLAALTAAAADAAALGAEAPREVALAEAALAAVELREGAAAMEALGHAIQAARLAAWEHANATEGVPAAAAGDWGPDAEATIEAAMGADLGTDLGGMEPESAAGGRAEEAGAPAVGAAELGPGAAAGVEGANVDTAEGEGGGEEGGEDGGGGGGAPAAASIVAVWTATWPRLLGSLQLATAALDKARRGASACAALGEPPHGALSGGGGSGRAQAPRLEDVHFLQVPSTLVRAASAALAAACTAQDRLHRASLPQGPAGLPLMEPPPGLVDAVLSLTEAERDLLRAWRASAPAIQTQLLAALEAAAAAAAAASGQEAASSAAAAAAAAAAALTEALAPVPSSPLRPPVAGGDAERADDGGGGGGGSSTALEQFRVAVQAAAAVGRMGPALASSQEALAATALRLSGDAFTEAAAAADKGNKEGRSMRAAVAAAVRDVALPALRLHSQVAAAMAAAADGGGAAFAADGAASALVPLAAAMEQNSWAIVGLAAPSPHRASRAAAIPAAADRSDPTRRDVVPDEHLPLELFLALLKAGYVRGDLPHALAEALALRLQASRDGRRSDGSGGGRSAGGGGRRPAGLTEAQLEALLLAAPTVVYVDRAPAAAAAAAAGKSRAARLGATQGHLLLSELAEAMAEAGLFDAPPLAAAAAGRRPARDGAAEASPRGAAVSRAALLRLSYALAQGPAPPRAASRLTGRLFADLLAAAAAAHPAAAAEPTAAEAEAAGLVRLAASGRSSGDKALATAAEMRLEALLRGATEPADAPRAAALLASLDSVVWEAGRLFGLRPAAAPPPVRSSRGGGPPGAQRRDRGEEARAEGSGAGAGRGGHQGDVWAPFSVSSGQPAADILAVLTGAGTAPRALAEAGGGGSGGGGGGGGIATALAEAVALGAPLLPTAQAARVLEWAAALADAEPSGVDPAVRGSTTGVERDALGSLEGAPGGRREGSGTGTGRRRLGERLQGAWRAVIDRWLSGQSAGVVRAGGVSEQGAPVRLDGRSATALVAAGERLGCGDRRALAALGEEVAEALAEASGREKV